jgi:hypothetical protein
VEFNTRPQRGGEDVGLGVFKGRGAVVWGAGVDGICLQNLLFTACLLCICWFILGRGGEAYRYVP